MTDTETTAVPFESVVEEQLAAPDSPLAREREKVRGFIERVARDYSLAVVAPHHLRGMPVDADALTFAAAVLRGLKLSAKRAGRQLRVVEQLSEVRDDPKCLYACVMPLSREHYGYDQDDREALGALTLEGKRAIFAGDCVWPTIGYFQRPELGGFSTLVLIDHHRWSSHAAPLKAQASDDVAIINAFFLFSESLHPNPSAISTGALMATLVGEDPDDIMRFIAQLSVLGDGYAAEHPKLVTSLDQKHADTLIRRLNDFGTYLATAVSRELSNWRLLQRTSIRQLVEAIAKTTTLEELEHFLAKSMPAGATLGYLSWREALTREVDRTVQAFNDSAVRVFPIRIKMPLENTLLIHRKAWNRLGSEGMGARVLIHVGYDADEFVAICARGEGAEGVDLGKHCSVNPLGDEWGGGHPERAGFNTMGLDDEQRESYIEWSGGTMNHLKTLNWFVITLMKGLKGI